MSTFCGDFTRRQEVYIHQQLNPDKKVITGYKKPQPKKKDWRAEFIALHGEDKFYEMMEEMHERDERIRRENSEDYDTDGHGNVISDADPGL